MCYSKFFHSTSIKLREWYMNTKFFKDKKTDCNLETSSYVQVLSLNHNLKRIIICCVLVPKSYLTLLWLPWTVAHQTPLFMGFPRQKYRSGLPFPSPGDLPNPGIKLVSPTLTGRFFTTEPPGKPQGIRKPSLNLWHCPWCDFQITCL